MITGEPSNQNVKWFKAKAHVWLIAHWQSRVFKFPLRKLLCYYWDINLVVLFTNLESSFGTDYRSVLYSQLLVNPQQPIAGERKRLEKRFDQLSSNRDGLLGIGPAYCLDLGQEGQPTDGAGAPGNSAAQQLGGTGCPTTICKVLVA